MASCWGACSKNAGPTSMRGLRAVRITPGIRWMEQAIRLIVRAATRIRNRMELNTSNSWRLLKTSVQPP